MIFERGEGGGGGIHTCIHNLPFQADCTIFILIFQGVSLNDRDEKAYSVYPGLEAIKLFFMQLI